MKAVIRIAGYFAVTKYEKNEYGTQCNISELGEVYPVGFALQLPDGVALEKGSQIQLDATCEVQEVGKVEKRFKKYVVKEMKFKHVTMEIKEVKA